MVTMDFNIPVVQPVNFADEVGKWSNINSNRQQQRLIDMKIQQAPEEMAMQRKMQQAQLSDHESSASVNEGKAEEQKMVFAANVSKMILSRANASGVDSKSPEYQQVVDNAGAPFRQQMAAVFGHQDDPSKPIDINALNSLAGYNPGGEHQKVIYTQQHGADGEYSFNGATGETAPIMQNGKHLQAAQYSPTLQGQIMRAKEVEKIDPVELSNGATVPMRMGNAVSDNRSSAPPQFDISPNASPQDRAILEGMKAQTGGVSVQQPISIGQSTEAAEKVKRESNIAEAEAKKGIEVRKQVEVTQAKNANSAKAMLSRLSEKIDGKSIDELIDQATGSGAGVIRDGVMNFMGKTTDAADAAAALKTVEGWLTSSVPRMEGPQGEKDVALYKSMAADIGDPSVPSEQKKKKLLALRAMMQDQDRAAPQEKTQDIHSLADDILRGK
jgi:hypothetical protein